MGIRHTTIALILWFFCQQAGAVVSGIYFVDGTETNALSSESCHNSSGEDQSNLVTKDISGNSHNNHNVQEATASMESCDISCQCCINGCGTIFSVASIYMDFNPMGHLLDHYSMIVISTHGGTPFRPPIFV